jgi:hypothetical protein
MESVLNLRIFLVSKGQFNITLMKKYRILGYFFIYFCLVKFVHQYFTVLMYNIFAIKYYFDVVVNYFPNLLFIMFHC